MPNSVALVLAFVILGAVGWDVLLNDAFWVTTWARRTILIIEWARFWD